MIINVSRYFCKVACCQFVWARDIYIMESCCFLAYIVRSTHVLSLLQQLVITMSIFHVCLSFNQTGIHLRKESDKHQKPTCLPSTSVSKRKLRKRRAHGIRSTGPPADAITTARQLTRSQADTVPPSPVKGKFRIICWSIPL